MGALPPVSRAALAFAVGVALSRIGALWSIAPLLIAGLALAPIRLSVRRPHPWLWALISIAGIVAGVSSTRSDTCHPVGLLITGRFLARPAGGAAPFRLDGGACEARVVLSGVVVRPGVRVQVEGEWREGRGGPWFLGQGAQDLPSTDSGWRWIGVRWRDSLVERLRRQYGERAPLVSALILARREGLDPEVREAFARSGTAHLLAISGFHVGVVAGIMLTLLRLARLSRRRAAVGAAGITWLYVALLGFPDAACRAALIIALVAVSRARGRPPARWGALGAALLLLLAQDASRLWSPGFQLSFGGAAGLVAWSRPIQAWITKLSRGLMPAAMSSGLAAGIAATAATLPIVAWHFERISLAGIPATLAASPLVGLAVPGAICALALDLVSERAGAFVAGGVTVVLGALEVGTSRIATYEHASVWVSHATVQLAACGVALGVLVARRERLRGARRRMTTAAWALMVLALWPVLLSWSGRGTVQLVFIDVGQGDAIAIRTPKSRWLVVDAGPPSHSPGEPHPVLRELRRRGAQRIEALVLTHPDLDHIGGATALLSSVPIGEVVDPARPSPKRAYIEVLEASVAEGVPWRRAQAGDHWEIDGVVLDVLAPGEHILEADTDANASSVVLRLRWGDFDALLMGDAPAAVEQVLAGDFDGGIEVLKVGHHGSDTSSDSVFLAHTRPEIAIVSAGRRNRFGHPSPKVLGRLDDVGAHIRRTDREGTIRITARADGTYVVDAERPQAGLPARPPPHVAARAPTRE